MFAIALAACAQVTNETPLSETDSLSTKSTTIVTEPMNKLTPNAEMSEKERDIVAKLAWLETADPVRDARLALADRSQGAIELIAFSGRGKSFPGLTMAEYDEIKNQVNYRMAEGSGDTLYGPTHKQLRKDLRNYASIYNRTIYGSLLN